MSDSSGLIKKVFLFPGFPYFPVMFPFIQHPEQSGSQIMKCWHGGFQGTVDQLCRCHPKALPSPLAPGPRLLCGSFPNSTEGDQGHEGHTEALSTRLCHP